MARPNPSDGPNRAQRRYVQSYHRRGLKTPQELLQEHLEKLGIQAA